MSAPRVDVGYWARTGHSGAVTARPLLGGERTCRAAR
jgi:hypothetical protein